MSITTIACIYKDYYPMPGERIKQYVVDGRRETAWERETCPKFKIAGHVDNCDDGRGYSTCFNAGMVTWDALVSHPHCETCNDFGETLRDDARVLSWLAEKARRPPIEPDRSKLSDEVEPDRSLELHPILKGLLPR